MLDKIKDNFIAKGSYLGYLGLVLLVIIGLMNVVHNITYLIPTDGAVWQEEGDHLVVAETDQSPETKLEVGDILLFIDDVSIDTQDDYSTYLFEHMAIGSKHLYVLERAGNRFEPFVVIRGLKEDIGEFYLFAVTGFAYLIFLILILSQHVPFGSKASLIAFCLFVYLRFVFHYTDRFSTLDWISFLLAQVGGILLPSALAGVALNQSFSGSKWLPFTQILHWIPSFALLSGTLTWYAQLVGLTPHLFPEDLFTMIQRLQSLWGGALIVISILLLGLVAELRFQEKNFSFYWAIAWLPFALTLWNLQYPYSNLVAGLTPIILPIALLFEWSGQGEMHLAMIGKKMVVYFSVVFVLMLGYFFFIGLFQVLLGTQISQNGQTIILGIGIMFAAVSYNPLNHYFADVLDRLIYGQRFHSIRLLLDMAGINRADTNIDRFLDIIRNRLLDAFLVESAVAYKVGASSREFTTIASIQNGRTLLFEDTNPLLLDGVIIRGHQVSARLLYGDGEVFKPNDYVCPIRVADKLAALIVLTPEGKDLKLSPEELRLLKSLLHQCDVLMENMELYQSVHQKVVSINQLKEYNENIIESSHIGILTTDELGKAVSCNSALAEMSGLEKSAILGSRFEELFIGKDLKTQRQVKSGMTMEGTFLNKAKEELLLGIEKTPLKTRENDVYGTLFLIEDIREKKHLDDILMQQEKLASIGLLAAGIAHEINTPLTGITSYSQMLVQDPGIDENQKELLELILGQGQRAANIVTELLHFSRKESEPKGPINLLDVLNQTLRFLSHQIQKRHVMFTVVEPEEVPEINGYANQIQQVFVNMIVNAMDAMPKGGKLEIGIKKHRDRVDVWFKDSGMGMTEHTRNHLFDPFYTTKEVGKGTGLGLSVCFKILQDHDATVRVDSAVGKGTTFMLMFHKEKPAHHWHTPAKTGAGGI